MSIFSLLIPIFIKPNIRFLRRVEKNILSTVDPTVTQTVSVEDRHTCIIPVKLVHSKHCILFGGRCCSDPSYCLVVELAVVLFVPVNKKRDKGTYEF